MSRPSAIRGSSSNPRRRSRTRSVSIQPYPLSPTNRRKSSLSQDTLAKTPTSATSASHPPVTPAAVRELRNEARELADDREHSIREEEEEEAELSQLLAGDEWSEGEVTLFTKVRRRGKEPLFPDSWRLDFATFPEALYTPPGSPSFISAIDSKNEFLGTQAFQKLLNVGGQVRDRIEVNPTAPVEPLIYHEIKKFLNFAEKDSSLSLSSILTLTYNRDRKGTSSAASERVEKRMRALATGLRSRNLQRAQEKSKSKANGSSNTSSERKPAKVIFGITVFNCVAALSTLNCEREDGDVKNIVVLDWSDKALDLWNAIGIALLIIIARNDILHSDEEATLQTRELPDEDA